MIGQILSLLKTYTSGLKRKPLYAAFREDHVFCLTEMKEQSHCPQQHSIYKGKVVRIENSFEAAFIDIGALEPGFLPLRKIALHYYPQSYAYQGRPQIRDVVRIGQEVLVQLEKLDQRYCHAHLTTLIAIPGQYLTLRPNTPGGVDVSHPLDTDAMSALTTLLHTQSEQEEMSVVVTLAASKQPVETLTADLQSLLNIWDSVKAM